MSSNNVLKYKDDNDRCYGLAGMAMAIVVTDSEDLLASINLDAADSDGMMEFTPQFYFAGNPRLSARLAWNHIVEHYNLTMGLLVANVLSRYYVNLHQELTSEILQAIHENLVSEGKETCELDEDEVNMLFNKQFSYMQRLFRHPGVQGVVKDFVADLSERRHMSISEIMEGFKALSML